MCLAAPAATLPPDLRLDRLPAPSMMLRGVTDGLLIAVCRRSGALHWTLALPQHPATLQFLYSGQARSGTFPSDRLRVMEGAACAWVASDLLGPVLARARVRRRYRLTAHLAGQDRRAATIT